MVLTDQPYAEKSGISAGDKCHQCINCRSIASSLRFIAYTNVTHSVLSRHYVVLLKGPLEHPRKRASGLGGLIPDLSLHCDMTEKSTIKFLLHKGGAKCANVTLVSNVQNVMSICMLNTGLLALKSTTPHQ